MRRIRAIGFISTWLLGIATAATLTAGCKPYKIAPPPGFARVGEDESGVRMKGSDEVGLNLRVYDNVRGGTLAYWSEDLVHKLGERGYTLQAQTPVESDNGVAGTRFDFAYRAPESDTPKFFTTLLFVTDQHKVIVQLAGDAEHQGRIAAQVDAIAKETKVRGCRAWTDICDGPQPPRLATPSPQGSERKATADTTSASTSAGS